MALLTLAVSCSGEAASPTTSSTVAGSAPSTTSSTTAAATSTTTTTTATTTTAQPLPPSAEIVTEAGIEYFDHQRLDVVYPTAGGPWPVVVILHGRGGDRIRYEPRAREIASRGAVVFNASWRYLPPRFELALHDAACAVGYAHAHAGRFGGDPDQIVVLGYSAGAWIGSVVALAGPGACPDGATADAALDVAGLVGVSGAYQIASEGEAAFLEDADPDLWAALNPYRQIGANPDLEITLVHGDRDEAVPPEVAEAFAAALTDAGYAVELEVVAGAAHLSPARLLMAGTEAVVAMMR